MAEIAGRYATVWYFAPPNVAALLEQTAQGLVEGERDRVRIYPLDRMS